MVNTKPFPAACPTWLLELPVFSKLEIRKTFDYEKTIYNIHLVKRFCAACADL